MRIKLLIPSFDTVLCLTGKWNQNLHAEKFHTARVYGKKHLRFLSCFQVLQRKRDEDGGKGTRRETRVLCADDPIRPRASQSRPPDDGCCAHALTCTAYRVVLRAAALAEATRDHLPVRSPGPALSLGIPVHRPQSTPRCTVRRTRTGSVFPPAAEKSPSSRAGA